MELPKASYIHGADAKGQERLSVLNIILNKICLERLTFTEQEKLLDVGCGLGQFPSLSAISIEKK